MEGDEELEVCGSCRFVIQQRKEAAGYGWFRIEEQPDRYLGLRLPLDMYEALEAGAGRMGQKMSRYVRNALAEWLGR